MQSGPNCKKLVEGSAPKPLKTRTMFCGCSIFLRQMRFRQWADMKETVMSDSCVLHAILAWRLSLFVKITTALALAGRGLGGGAYQQAFAEVINSALLATTIFSSGQRYIFNGLQVCDPCYRGIILLLLIHLNQGQCFSCATFSSVPASRIYRKYKASRFSTRSILPL